MKAIKGQAKNLIFSLEAVAASSPGKHTFHLDYESGSYRQDALVRLMRDTVPYFALTPGELSRIDEEEFTKLITRAWNRISRRRKEMKGDYGELLLFLLLEVFFPAKKLITKVRLRSSLTEEVKGYDCTHFAIDADDKITFWLGEAKFHQSFSTAIDQAVKSIREHSALNKVKDELVIIEGNNTEIDEESRAKIEDYLNSRVSLDEVNIRIPVLLTYNCAAVARHDLISEEFYNDLRSDVLKRYASIDNQDLELPSNISVVFIVFPLEIVEDLKAKLERVEEAHR